MNDHNDDDDEKYTKPFYYRLTAWYVVGGSRTCTERTVTNTLANLFFDKKTVEFHDDDEQAQESTRSGEGATQTRALSRSSSSSSSAIVIIQTRWLTLVNLSSGRFGGGRSGATRGDKVQRRRRRIFVICVDFRVGWIVLLWNNNIHNNTGTRTTRYFRTIGRKWIPKKTKKRIRTTN